MFKQEVLNTKTSLAMFDFYFFKQPTGTIPGVVPVNLVNFFKHQDIDSSSIWLLYMMLTKTAGRWLIVNPKHNDYQSSIVLTLVNVTNTTSL